MENPKDHPSLTDFRASRIYAQGWNAARAASLGKKPLNPTRPVPNTRAGTRASTKPTENRSDELSVASGEGVEQRADAGAGLADPC